MTTFKQTLSLSLLATALAACTTQFQLEQPEIDLGPSGHYMCGDTPVATLTGEDHVARVNINGFSYATITSQTIYGLRYENLAAHPVLSFWDKGDTAVLELDGKMFPPCQKVKNPATEEIKNYRAIGNDPAWHLTIHNGQLVFNQNYREKLVSAELPAARLTPEGQSYVLKTGTQDMVVSIAHKACKDTLTLRYYPDQVRILMQGKEMKGCGNEISATEADKMSVDAPLPPIAAPTQPVTASPQAAAAHCGPQPTQPAALPIKPPARPLTDYTNKVWIARQIDGKDVVDMQPTLAFSEEGLYVAHGGCNRFSGGFRINDTALTIDPKMVETKKTCAADLIKQEQVFMSILKASTLIDLRDDTLILSTPHRKTIVFGSGS